MNLLKISVLGAALTLTIGSGAVSAQEEERNYDASVAVGYVGTSGNTETKTFNGEFLWAYRTTNWLHNVKLQAMGSSEDSITKAERYYLEDKSDYNLNSDSYLYGKASYTEDRFSGFEYQSTVSVGYGRYFYNRDAFKLQGFTGIGYRENDVVDAGSVGETIFTLGEVLEWDISETSRLVQEFTTDIGDELTITKFEIGLESNIINNIVAKIAFEIRNTSKVPVGTEKTDTLTSISMVYSF